MGVLNVTPDSFADAAHVIGGPTGSPDVDRSVALALRMEAAGADLIDIGGESTRPGAVPVPTDVELARVIPVIRSVTARVGIPVSVDTYKPEVATAAVDAGAALINDISGLLYERSLAEAVARSGAALVLMHTRGRSASIYAEAEYGNLIAEVATELQGSIDRALAAGVSSDRLIVDPGIGFAKRAEHSYGVLARCPELGQALGRPLLLGPSRKSFLQAAVGDRPAIERDWATAAAVSAAVFAGAHIVRVHAVPELVQVVRVAEMIRRAGAPR
jgi:dihydropteroate synthase